MQAQVKIDFQMIVKHAFVHQINEEKQVSVIWRRGNRELETQPGTIATDSHEAKIEDQFRMKTNLDMDVKEQTFEPKITVMSLVFTDTKDEIGHYDFNLATYANQFLQAQKEYSAVDKAPKKVKKVLDLKSEKFPGSQIYIYILIGFLEPIPTLQLQDKTLKGSTIANLAKVTKFDAASNEQELKKQNQIEEIRILSIDRDKLTLDLERIEHKHQQLKTNDLPDYQSLLKSKTDQLNKIKEKIKKIGKQESIIVKVLNIINDGEESQKMYEQTDEQIQQQLEQAKQEWDKKNKELKKMKNVKKNFGDIDYYADMVQF